MADDYSIEDTAAELFFYLIDPTTGLPRTGETGTPEIRKQGGSWLTDGVSALSESGNGHYWCTVDLTDVTLAPAAGDIIDGRVKTTNAAEAPSLNEIGVVSQLGYQRQILGAASIVIGPVVTSPDAANFVGETTALAMFKKEAKTFLLTVLDADDAVVDISGMTLRFTVETRDVSRTVVFTKSGASITVSGASNEIANVAVLAADSNVTADTYDWRLWDDSTSQVLLHGPFDVLSTSET